MNQADTIIIGAGLSGLVLARLINGKGTVIVLEKSKGVGGRIATRRMEDIGLDHGALHLENNPVMISEFQKAGLSHQITKDGIYCDGGMTRLAKKLAEGLDIRKETRVSHLVKKADGWIVETDNGTRFEAANVILTAPMPQALELLEKSKIPYNNSLREITYDKAILALLVCDRSSLPDKPSIHLHSITPMALRGLHPTGFVVRATPAFSDAHFEVTDERNLELLIENFKSSFLNPPEIRLSELKKWRYVVPRSSLPAAFETVDQGLYLTGDSFLSPNAAGALESAHALALKLT